jgi:hypothetical protein
MGVRGEGERGRGSEMGGERESLLFYNVQFKSSATIFKDNL